MSGAVVLGFLAGASAAAALADATAVAARTRARRALRAGNGGDARDHRPGRPGSDRAPTSIALGVLALLARLGRRAGLPLPSAADVGRRLDAAGMPAHIGPADLATIKLGAALAAMLLVLAPALAAPPRLAVLLLLAAPAAAFVAPELWLARRARTRAAAMALEVADILDLLRVALAAGLTPARALGEVGRRRGGLIGAELLAASERIVLGVAHADAYATLAARCPVATMRALVRALVRAERHGTSLDEALHALAVDARTDRVRALEVRAARAAPKIQLVVALLLVPAVLLLVASALVRALAG